MTPIEFMWWCLVVGVGGAFVVLSIGVSVAFISHTFGLRGWKR